MLAVAAALLGAMLAVSLVVEPAGEHSSRLLTRGGGSPARTGLGRAFARTVFDPLHFAMERRMLEGIRGLAENHPVSRTRDLMQLSSWAATFVLFVASGTLVLLGSRSWRRLLGFAAAGVAFQIVTLVQPACPERAARARRRLDHRACRARSRAARRARAGGDVMTQKIVCAS